MKADARKSIQKMNVLIVNYLDLKWTVLAVICSENSSLMLLIVGKCGTALNPQPSGSELINNFNLCIKNNKKC